MTCPNCYSDEREFVSSQAEQNPMYVEALAAKYEKKNKRSKVYLLPVIALIFTILVVWFYIIKSFPNDMRGDYKLESVKLNGHTIGRFSSYDKFHFKVYSRNISYEIPSSFEYEDYYSYTYDFMFLSDINKKSFSYSDLSESKNSERTKYRFKNSKTEVTFEYYKDDRIIQTIEYEGDTLIIVWEKK